MSAEVEVPSGMPNIRFDPTADPDAQATVNDFIDYTELFPSDLIRSLQLIGQLDRTYHQATAKVHELTKTYGAYPLLSSSERPDSLELRAQISQALDRATACRQAAAAEADRLYTTAERLSSRLTIIKAKLQALPQPPSRDPTPLPQSPQNTRSRRQDLHSGPRLTLHMDRARQTSQKPQKKRLFVPGEPLPSGPDYGYSESEQSDDDMLESMRSTSMDLGLDAPDQATRGGRPGRVKIQKSIKPSKLKIPKTPKIRPPGVMGTNVHSSIAGISTSNALAKLTPPPADAKAGSKFRPWLRLTEYEMAFLRKTMKKNAVWTPSDTMIRRELAKDGRGRENYEKAKAHAEATGEPFLDEDPFILGKANIALGEVSWSSPDAGETINRGMRLNEAKKQKKEKEKEAAREGDQLEDVNRKMQLFGDQLKTLFSRGSPVALSPMAQQPTLPKSSKKRKRDSDQPSASSDANAPSAAFQDSPGPKKLKLGPPVTIKIAPKPVPKLAAKPSSPIRTITTTTQIPLAPAGPSSSPKSTTTTRRAATPAISPPDIKKSAATPTQPTAAQSRSRRTSVKPEHALPSTPKEHREFNIRPRSRGSVISGKAASAEPPSHKESRELRELRRASVIETKPEFDNVTAPRTTRGGRRPAPGLVTADEDGKGKVSVGKRKAAPKRKSSIAATQPKSVADNKGSSTEKTGATGSNSAVVEDDWDVDPDEPTYCICNQVSYGTMIACENDECDKEWFHLQCVGLEEIPPRRAKWYCPDCRKKFGIDEKGNASSSILSSGGRR